MTKNEHEVMVACPVERVFRFVTDFGTWRQWHGSDQNEAKKITPGPVDVGTVWKLSGPVQGQLITMTVQVTEYEPSSRFGFKTTSGPIDARQTFAFERVEGGTRLTTAVELANLQFAQAARQQWDNDLLILKEVLEAKTQGRPR